MNASMTSAFRLAPPPADRRLLPVAALAAPSACGGMTRRQPRRRRSKSTPPPVARSTACCWPTTPAPGQMQYASAPSWSGTATPSSCSPCCSRRARPSAACRTWLADWERPTGHWIDARSAFYVFGSRKKGRWGHRGELAPAPPMHQVRRRQHGGRCALRRGDARDGRPERRRTARHADVIVRRACALASAAGSPRRGAAARARLAAAEPPEDVCHNAPSTMAPRPAGLAPADATARRSFVAPGLTGTAAARAARALQAGLPRMHSRPGAFSHLSWPRVRGAGEARRRGGGASRDELLADLLALAPHRH